MNEIASLENVRSAVEALDARGENVTANAVIAEIGGGSKTTVVKHLREIRQIKDLALEGLSSTLLEKIKPILLEIHQQGAQAQETRALEQTQRLHRYLGEQEEQVDELMSELDIVTRERDAVTSELGTVKSALAKAEELHAAQAKELEQVRSDLAAAQNEQAAWLRDAVKQFEVLNTALLAQNAGKQTESETSAQPATSAVPTRRPRGRPPKVRDNA